MNVQTSAAPSLVSRLHRAVVFSTLLLSLTGCGRSSVVMTPENPAQPEATLRTKAPVVEAPAAEEVRDKPSPVRTPVAEAASKKPEQARARAEEPEAARPFRLPDDAGGVLLAKVLPPRDAESPRLEQGQAPPRSGPAPALSVAMKPPVLPLPPSQASLPRLPAEKRHVAFYPVLVVDETLGGFPDNPAVPQAPALPQRRRVRAPSPDVNEPTPLPILARPISERASLDDPTLEASSAAAISAPIPPRTSKAPFLKLTLPDPYERRHGDMPSPEESKDFPIGTPHTPR